MSEIKFDCGCRAEYDEAVEGFVLRFFCSGHSMRADAITGDLEDERAWEK